MYRLLWAERQKLRRSKIVWITIFATIFLAVFIFVSGQERYEGLDVHYGLKTVSNDSRYIDNAGWYMDEVQPWATFFVLPAVIALLGSYFICREEDEDTMKSLRLIPINEVQLTVAKLIIAFVFSIFLYLLLFAITLMTEAILHCSDLSAELVFGSLKEYILDGVGVFLAISPVIALVSRMKKYWFALLITEIYSVAGLFVSMSNDLKAFYPIAAVFHFSGYYITTLDKVMGSVLILLLCGCLSVFLLIGQQRNKK